MLKSMANYISLVLLFIAFITHIFKLIYLFYKPLFFKRIKYLSNETPSKTDLALYYFLTMGSCYYAFIHIINK